MNAEIISALKIVLTTFVCSALIMPFMKKIAHHVGAIDIPRKDEGNRHIHTKATPKLGGVGIFLAFLIGYMLFGTESVQMNSILIGSFIIILTGIADDIKSIRASTKLIGQLIAACILVFYGGFLLNNITAFGYSVDFGIFSYPLTIFFIVACVNIINLIDGLDGLCAGITSIYFLTISIIGFILNKFGGLDIIISLMMLGCTLGYLVHNFPPAKIYQGDSGSTFCGLMISVVFLLGFKTTTLTSLIIPTLLLAIPIMDTLFAIIRRKLKGQKIDHADKQHLHHQLLKKFSTKNSILLIYAINLLFSITSIFYALGHDIEVVVCYIILLFIVLFLILKTDIIFERSKNK